MSDVTKYCVYPIANPDLNIGKNPYVNNLISATNNYGKEVVNKNEFTSFGIFSLTKYLFSSDAFIFNWLESLQNKRYGTLQSCFLPFLLLLLRLLGKKIIVIFHNKFSHNNNSFLSKINVFFSVILASKVVTHAKEGKFYLINKFGRLIKNSKVIFVYHPVYSSEIVSCKNNEQKYDFIIWGAITPYKGVYEFLEFLKNNPQYNNKRILICGKISSNELFNKLLEFNLDNVKIIDAFINDEKLKKYISISRKILFVYSCESVLSSGSLIKSLNYNKPIIGPSKGAFKDLEELEIVTCFNAFKDIFNNSSSYRKEEIKNFISINNWNSLIGKIL